MEGAAVYHTGMAQFAYTNLRSRSGNGATQGPTLVTRAGPSEGMGESIPLTEIKILDRDGQPAHDADIISVQSQQEVREAMLPYQATVAMFEDNGTMQGLGNGNDGEGDEANEANGVQTEGRALVADKSLPIGAPSDHNDSREVSTDGKLDEELVRQVLQDALDAKRKQEDPWMKCAKEVWEFEESLVEKWKEDINNLLLFSGLFSTVLTGFIVPFYVTLAATQALISMSGHLSVVAADAGHTTIANWLISLSADSQFSSGPSSTIIAVAVLWFAALILSLGTASVAISISQWLHHHVNGTSKTSQRSVRVWFFRRRGLTRWGVEQAVAVLPLLLQFSLVLFLLGLDILLWTLSTAVASVATVLSILLLVPTIFTAIIPSFSPDCPFKSAQAWWFFRFWRWAMRQFEKLWFGGTGSGKIICRIWNQCCRTEKWRTRRDLPALGDWRELDNFCMQTLEDVDGTKLKMLVEANSRVMDETFLSTVVQPCLLQADVSEALLAFYEIVNHRAHDHDQDEEHSPRWYYRERDYQVVDMLGHMSIALFEKVASNEIRMDDETRKKEQKHILTLVNRLLSGMPRTTSGVYSWLVDMWARTSIPDEIRIDVALSLGRHHWWFHSVGIDTSTLQRIVTFLSNPRKELGSGIRSFQCSNAVLCLSADFPLSDSGPLCEDIQGALSIVAKYISSSDIKFVAQEITAAHEWPYVYRMVKACASIVKRDASLFTKHTIDALARCAEQWPPDDDQYANTQRAMKRIRKRFAQSQEKQ
ncbi:predicted protein [Postia placenta Mad-698-R]|nr:predicted protein [Postia placenta Mad-698-R]